ncbi:homoserine acetyltransferase [Rhizoclosmatium globosum]|uniref:Homoserine acetyltransferase n=1 Tax=Rhizoclosmatium globosum TaxID=329046 RepID=A0A1Y2CH24_9FUNG|nr:homoserine acetyltransferase [Rhizoclosmatium globosum]|eukprot:ORY46339.1 homoserine acetyltransferase [Rhizoclosmatium globosum]
MLLSAFRNSLRVMGKTNEKKDNVILLTTGLSGSSHAKSHYGNRADGWWEKFIGPGLPLDTNKFHIICTNVIGGVMAQQGLLQSTHTHQKKLANPLGYGRAQFRLMDHLGIQRLHAVVGSSMGGMQSLAAASLFPERVNRVISISAAARSHPYSIALRHAQRQVLMSDPNWMGGMYYEHGLARQIGTITYRSGPEWEMRFGRKRSNPSLKPSLKTDFMIESYLEHQAMDMFDMTDRPSFDPNDISSSSLSETGYDEKYSLITTYPVPCGRNATIQSTLVIGVKSDFLIPSWQQQEIATCLKDAGNKMVTHFEIDGVYGHDTFLLDFSNVGSAVKGHLEIPTMVQPETTKSVPKPL